jgi:hypothetical protein
MNLEELKTQKKMDMVTRMENAMYQHYFGGDTFIVKNINITQEGSEIGLITEVKNQYFTSKELEFIETENILNFFNPNWDIEILKNKEFENVIWLFRAKN